MTGAQNHHKFKAVLLPRLANVPVPKLSINAILVTYYSVIKSSRAMLVVNGQVKHQLVDTSIVVLHRLSIMAILI